MGLQYAAAKLAAHENVAPIGSLFANHLVLLGAFLIVMLAWRASFRPLLKHIGFFAAVSAFNNIGRLGSELIAAQHVLVGELSLINSLIPLLTILIVVAFRTEVESRAKILTVLFGFAAAFYLFALLTRLGGAVFASCSDFIAICAGLFWGFVFFTEIPTLWMIAAASLSFIALKIAAGRTSAEVRALALSN